MVKTFFAKENENSAMDDTISVQLKVGGKQKSLQLT